MEELIKIKQELDSDVARVAAAIEEGQRMLNEAKELLNQASDILNGRTR